MSGNINSDLDEANGSSERAPLLGSGSSNNPRYTENESDGAGDRSGAGNGILSSGSGQHCHDDNLEAERMDKKAMRKLILATFLCLTFMIVEIVGGVLANSLAIITDAAHLFTDLVSFVISMLAVWIASGAPTKRMSFGYYRAEVMGALISTLMIWVVTGILVYLAIQRVITQDYEIDAKVMLITSGLAILFNIIMACSLGHTHSHAAGGSHGHSHAAHTESDDVTDPEQQLLPGYSAQGGIQASEYEIDKEKDNKHHDHHSGNNINVRAAFIHVIGDFIQSVGVFIAALIIFFKPEWKIADPICTFLFSVLVLITTFTILKDTLNVLMEGLPRGMDYSEVKKSLMSVEGVREVHNLRLWSLTVNKCALAVHLAVDKAVNSQHVVVQCSRIMREKYKIQECTIQVEDYVQEMDDCTHCQDPRD